MKGTLEDKDDKILFEISKEQEKMIRIGITNEDNMTEDKDKIIKNKIKSLQKTKKQRQQSHLLRWGYNRSMYE